MNLGRSADGPSRAPRGAARADVAEPDGAVLGTPRALLVLLAAGSLVVMAGAAIAPVLPLIADRFRLDAEVAGLVVTTHALTIAVASPLVGALIDRLGTRPVLTGGLVGYAVAGGAGALATGFPALLVARILFGVAAAAVLNGGTVAMLNLWRGRDRDRVMGYWATANSAGGVVWTVVAGLVGTLGWQWPFLVYLVALPIAVLALWLLPEALPRRRGPARQTAPPATSIWAVVRANPVLGWLYVIVFVVQLELYTIIVFVPQRMAELGVRLPVVAAVGVAAVNLAAVVAGLGYARLRSRAGFRSLLLAAGASAIVAFAILFVADAPWLLLVATPLFGLGLPIMLASAPALLARQEVPGHLRGRLTAVQSSMMLLGQFAGPLLLGLFATPLGVRAVFGAALVVAVVETAAMAAAFRPDRIGATGQPLRG